MWTRHRTATPYVPILFATSPLLAIRSAPTIAAWIFPSPNSFAAMLSVMSVQGIPSFDSSQAVSLAPCRNGRVSST